MNIKTFFNTVKHFPPSQAILMRGGTGIGKSQIARQIADYHNVPLIDVRGSTMSEGDTGGYPDIEAMKENGVMTFVMPSWFVRACREPVVLLLDELNRSLRGVQQSFFQLVLDREMGNDKDGNPYRLNPETRVIAAVNHGSEYDVNDMDPALLRRFYVADLECQVKDWLGWAKNNNIHEIIMDFIAQYHEHLVVDPSSVEPGQVIPTPASWHSFNNVLDYAKISLDDFAGSKSRPTKIFNIASGFLGQETSITFTEFVQKYNNTITPLNVIDEWSKYKEKIESLSSDKLNALISKIANHFADNEWTISQAENAAKFAKIITHEMLIHFWSELTSTNNLPNIRKVHKFMANYVVEVVNTNKELLK